MQLVRLRVLLSITLLLPVITRSSTSICHCQLNEACWPSDDDWKALNGSVSGHLVRVRPVADVCHGSAYDAESCDEVRAHTNDAVWRTSQPGALVWTNWETLPEHNEDCYNDGLQNRPCKQGRISPYAVMAETVEDIQEALKFGKERNIHLVIRNTGHDLSGRSSGPSSLQINLSKFKGVHYTENFIPQGGHEPLGKAATLEAGTLGAEFAKDAEENGYIPLIGLCPSVGIAGGYLQGGGISSLAPIYGLAADHALEFEVITAEGDLVIANEYQNQDLFWALRGGGGGTFGIAIRSTVRVFDDFPALFQVALITVPNGFKEGLTDANEALWDIVGHVLRLIPTLNDGKTGANFGLTHMPGDNALITMEIVFTDVRDKKVADKQLEEMYSALHEREIRYELTSKFFPRYSAGVQRPMQPAGWGNYDGSILLSEKFLSSVEAPSKIVEVLSQIRLGVGGSFEIDMLGGQVMKNDAVGTALHPSWREALALLILHKSLSISPTAEMQKQGQMELTNIDMPLLRSLEADSRRMGSYSNGADPNEPHFQQVFWDDAYERLSQIKRDWDKNELFISRNAVGSEGWDAEGLCRVS